MVITWLLLSLKRFGNYQKFLHLGNSTSFWPNGKIRKMSFIMCQETNVSPLVVHVSGVGGGFFSS